MQRLFKGALVVLSLVVFPSAAFAQASIVGTARDASGAVLPGVTVEASSPALIEKTRSVITNGVGQYSHSGSATGHVFRHASRCPASPRSSAMASS